MVRNPVTSVQTVNSVVAVIWIHNFACTQGWENLSWLQIHGRDQAGRIQLSFCACSLARNNSAHALLAHPNEGMPLSSYLIVPSHLESWMSCPYPQLNPPPVVEPHLLRSQVLNMRVIKMMPGQAVRPSVSSAPSVCQANLSVKRDTPNGKEEKELEFRDPWPLCGWQEYPKQLMFPNCQRGRNSWTVMYEAVTAWIGDSRPWSWVQTRTNEFPEDRPIGN